MKQLKGNVTDWLKQEKFVRVDVPAGTTTVVRERDGTDGWLDNNLAISFLGEIASNGSTGAPYYLDKSDQSGWAHLYAFPVSGNASAIPLTSGKWEVDSILKVDRETGLVYYTSTEQHSTERHVYSVSYRTLEKKLLVPSDPAVWSASFSSSGAFYILTYSGPDVPYQELYALNSTTPLRTLTSNQGLYNSLAELNLPNITYFELEHPSGVTLNVQQRLPANFDPSQQYPILFTPYGGPGAQEISKAWSSLSWNAYIASDPELQYITWTVDNRGTGFKGRAFRALVAKRLGTLEADDQIWAAHQALSNPWVDPNHVGIWGWSYGGYLTSKVLERQASGDAPFTLGLITAPVADWRLYDSMYTERYMKTYEQNPAGYNTSAVRDAAGFKAVKGGFLIQHGTGDDNVHFQNSAAMVDRLVGQGVGPDRMQVQWFTDSDHGIRYNGASAFLYRQLTKRLYEEVLREGEGEVHQWSRRGVRREGRGGRGWAEKPW